MEIFFFLNCWPFLCIPRVESCLLNVTYCDHSSTKNSRNNKFEILLLGWTKCPKKGHFFFFFENALGELTSVRFKKWTFWVQKVYFVRVLHHPLPPQKKKKSITDLVVRRSVQFQYARRTVWWRATEWQTVLSLFLKMLLRNSPSYEWN